MTPTAILREEHRLIRKALDILDATAAHLAAGEHVPEALWSALVHWLHAFADIRHHAKEEDLLYPAMVRAGVPYEGGPVDVMLEEHDLGRALLETMAEDRPGQRAVEARRYTRLLRDHLSKEDLILFPLAEEVLAAREVERLRRDFERTDLQAGRGQSIAEAEAVLDGLVAALESFLTPH
jgi:hemerythrin-like domain-containing protein